MLTLLLILIKIDKFVTYRQYIIKQEQLDGKP